MIVVWPLGVNYIYGTWQVLRGLRALGLSMREPWLLQALRLA
jgi:squalene-hopene/tetraprenyl-beta-curcumene cyclase